MGSYVDADLPIPEVYRGNGEIRLVVLGQDPTIKNSISRKKIHCVLNLDRSGNLRTYLARICAGLGISLEENVYATNLYKNFFIEPPTQIRSLDVFRPALRYWLPLLKEELAEFSGVPVITLGEPLLSVLVTDLRNVKVRDYWGYVLGWKPGEHRGYRYLYPEENVLNHVIFPFPHQPSLRKQYYKDNLERYIGFMKQTLMVLHHLTIP